MWALTCGRRFSLVWGLLVVSFLRHLFVVSLQLVGQLPAQRNVSQTQVQGSFACISTRCINIETRLPLTERKVKITHRRLARVRCCSVEVWERGISEPRSESASPEISVFPGWRHLARAPPAWPTENQAEPAHSNAECELNVKQVSFLKNVEVESDFQTKP